MNVLKQSRFRFPDNKRGRALWVIGTLSLAMTLAAAINGLLFEILTVSAEVNIVALMFFFPIGLELFIYEYLLGSSLPTVGGMPAPNGPVFWLLYAILSFPIIFTKTRRTSIIIYIILVLLLILNIAGCTMN